MWQQSTDIDWYGLMLQYCTDIMLLQCYTVTVSAHLSTLVCDRVTLQCHITCLYPPLHELWNILEEIWRFFLNIKKPVKNVEDEKSFDKDLGILCSSLRELSKPRDGFDIWNTSGIFGDFLKPPLVIGPAQGDLSCHTGCQVQVNLINLLRFFLGQRRSPSFIQPLNWTSCRRY